MRFVPDHTILSVVVGSRAYGLDGPASDHDRRGVFAAPTRLFWRLDKPPTHLDGPPDEEFSWEIERDRLLAVKNGQVPFTAWADEVLADLAGAAAETRLPDHPDRETIDRVLIGVRERGLRQ